MSIKGGGFTDSVRRFEDPSAFSVGKEEAGQYEDSATPLVKHEAIAEQSQEYTFGYQIEKPSDDARDENYVKKHDVIEKLVGTERSYSSFWRNGQQLLADSRSDFNDSDVNEEQHRNFFKLLEDPKIDVKAKRIGVRIMARKAEEGGCEEPNSRAELFRHATLAIKFYNHSLKEHWQTCVKCALKDVVMEYQNRHPLTPPLSKKELALVEKELLKPFGIGELSDDGFKPSRMQWLKGLKLEAELKVSPELLLEYATGEQGEHHGKAINKGYIAKTHSVIEDSDFEVLDVVGSGSESSDSMSAGGTNPISMRSLIGAKETNERDFEKSFDSQATASVTMVDQARMLRMNSYSTLKNIPAMSLKDLTELTKTGEPQYTEQSASFNASFADETGALVSPMSRQSTLDHQELSTSPSRSERSVGHASENDYSSDDESLLGDAPDLAQRGAFSQRSLPNDGGSIGGISDLDGKISSHRRGSKVLQLEDDRSVHSYSLSERSATESVASHSSIALAESIEKNGYAAKLGKLFLATKCEPEMKSVRIPRGETYKLISSNGLSYHLLNDKKEQVELSMAKHSQLPLTNMPVKAAFIVGSQVIQSATTPEELFTYYKEQVQSARLSPALVKCLESEIQARCVDLAKGYPTAIGKYDSLDLMQERVSKAQSLRVVLGEFISEAGFKSGLKEFAEMQSLDKETADGKEAVRTLTRQRMEKMTNFAKDNYLTMELSGAESEDRSKKLRQLAKHWIGSEVVDYPEARKYLLEIEKPGPNRDELLSMFERAEGARVKKELSVANRRPGHNLKATIFAELVEDGACRTLTSPTLHENGIWNFIDRNLKDFDFSSFTTEELDVINNAYASRVPTEEYVRDILPKVKEQLALKKPLEKFDELPEIPGIHRNFAGATVVDSVTDSIGKDNAVKLRNLVENYLFEPPEIEVAERKVAETLKVDFGDPTKASQSVSGFQRVGEIEKLEKQAAELAKARKEVIELGNEQSFQYQQLESAKKMEIREELVVAKVHELLKEGKLSFVEAKKVADDKEDSKFSELLNKAQERTQHDRLDEGRIGYTIARPTIVTPENVGVVMALDKAQAANIRGSLTDIHDYKSDIQAFLGIIGILEKEGFFSKLPLFVKQEEGIWQKIDHELLERNTNKMTTPQLQSIIGAYEIQREHDDSDARKVIEKLENSIRYRANRKVESNEAKRALQKIDKAPDVDETKGSGFNNFLNITGSLYREDAPKFPPEDKRKLHEYVLDILHSPDPRLYKKFRVRAQDRLPANDKYLKKVEQESSEADKVYSLRTSKTTGESYVVRDNVAVLKAQINDKSTRNPLKVVLCYKAIPGSQTLRMEAAKRLLELNGASCAPDLFADPKVFEGLTPAERTAYNSVMLDVLHREAVKTDSSIAINYVKSIRRGNIDPQAQFKREAVYYD